MERYTEKHYDGNGYYLICSGNCETFNCGDCGILDKIVDRLAAYEDTGLEPEEIVKIREDIENGYMKSTARRYGVPVDRLRELAEADRLIGMTAYEANKRGFISTYEVISVHISKCSILVGWNLLDGVYSNLNGFEISALGKSIFLTREEAEAALKAREQDGNTE